MMAAVSDDLARREPGTLILTDVFCKRSSAHAKNENAAVSVHLGYSCHERRCKRIVVVHSGQFFIFHQNRLYAEQHICGERYRLVRLF